MNKNRFKRIMAYVYMPLFFLLLGYGIIYIAFQPYINMAVSLSGIIISSKDTVRVTGLTSIFDANALTEEQIDAETIDISEVTLPYYEEQFAVISCEKVELYAPLYWGDSSLALDNGAAMHSSSQLPGFGGTMLVGGHNQTDFKPFQYLEVGDIITIQTNYGIYEYKVSEMLVREYDDPEAFDFMQDEQEILVAYTCYPFSVFTPTTSERLFVYAEKISGPEVIYSYG